MLVDSKFCMFLAEVQALQLDLGWGVMLYSFLCVVIFALLC